MATGTLEAPATPMSNVEPDGLYEVIGSQVVEKPPMGAFEYGLANRLGLKMGTFVAIHELGQVLIEMIFDLRPYVDRQRRPDVSFVSAQTWPIDRNYPNTATWKVIPNLAVEIVSPTNTVGEVLDKVEEYFQAGCRLVWFVFPSTFKIYVYNSPTSVQILTINDSLDGGDVIPGFQFAVREFFGRVEPAPGDLTGK